MLFATKKKESRKSFLYRFLFSNTPLYRATGARVTFCSADFQEIHVKLTKNLLTRNYVNTIFGGSIYSSIDPIFMLMLMEILGKNYVVWDKAATIRFVRPARQKLKARFLLDDTLIENIKKQIAETKETDLELTLEYLDEEEKICATFSKVLYIADKNFYAEKRKQKGQTAEYKTVI
ncbi:MAG: YiiD C-terminal domain-containing protein [Verrucomicrobia bacterium]|nr:YiiD C-terminal domain-containing protein [Cytophagales bacterium]